MATKSNPQSSGNIRRHIGQIKGRIKRRFDEYQSLQTIDTVSIQPQQARKTLEQAESILAKLEYNERRLQELLNEWTKIIEKNANEQDIKDKFIIDHSIQDIQDQTKLTIGSLRELITILQDSSTPLSDGESEHDTAFSEDALYVPDTQPQKSLQTIIVTQGDMIRTDIRPFGGDPSQYSGFRSLFRSSFDKDQYKPPQRLSALINSVRGTPYTLLSSLELTTANYEIAWKLLDNFYGMSQNSFQLLLQKLQDIPPTETKDIRVLQQTYALCYSLLHQLKKYNDRLDSISISLTILKKFPRAIVARLPNSDDTTDPTKLMDELSHIIQKECRLDTLFNSSSTNVSLHQTFHAQPQSRQLPRQQPRLPQHSSHPNTRSRSCPYCKQPHSSFNCPLSIDNKKQICMEQHLCHNCLNNTHTSRNCPSTKVCQKCQQRHHTSLHVEYTTHQRTTTPNIGPRHYSSRNEGYQSTNTYTNTPRPGAQERNSQRFQSSRYSTNPNPVTVPQHRNQPPFREHGNHPQPHNNNHNNNNNHNGRLFHQAASNRNNTSNQGTYPNRQYNRQYNVQRETTNHIQTNLTDTETSTPNETTIQTETPALYSIQVPNEHTKQMTPDFHYNYVDNRIPLLCLKIRVRNPEQPSKQKEAYAFFDSGSTGNFINQKLAEELELTTIRTTTLQIETFGEQTTPADSTTVHNIELLPIHLSTSTQPIPMDVYSVQRLTRNIDTIQPIESIEQNEHNSQITLVHRTVKPDILIGTQKLWSILDIGGDTFYTYPIQGFQVLNSKLGPLVVPRKDTIVEQTKVFSTNGILPDDTEDIAPIESLLSVNDSTQEEEDKLCEQFFRSTVVYDTNEQRYFVRWPMKTEQLRLPESRQIALRKQCYVFRQLSDRGLTKKYLKYFQDMLELGVIEAVPEETIHSSGTHYLLHFGVIRENSLHTQIRPVFNASAAHRDFPSLNQQMFRGPLWNQPMLDILIRSRLPPILIASDIAKAFLMIGLQPSEREICRFLLPFNSDLPFSQHNCIDYRFRHMPFGPRASPSLLSCVIKLHLEQFQTNPQLKELATEIEQNIYVDNIFLSAETIEEGKSKEQLCTEMFKSASMKVREWTSNNKDLTEYFEKKDADNKTPQLGKALGLQWDKFTDCYGVKPPKKETETTKIWTKRKVLKFTASNFDPLGILLPIITYCKIFGQKLCRVGYTMDAPLKPTDQKEWTTIMDSWINNTYWFPRRLPATQFDLHIFCDASQSACATSAYAVQFGIKPQFVSANGRVAPLHSTTIPKLELNALLMAATLAERLFTIFQHRIRTITLWSDSMIVLYWLTSTSTKLPIFVRNRVTRITKLLEQTKAKVRHVPGKDNPADIATRPMIGTDFQTLSVQERWLHGPSFLQKSPEQWPVLPVDNTPDITTMSLIAQEANEKSAHIIDTIHYSSFNHLINILCFVVTYLLRVTKGRFPHNLSGNKQRNNSPTIGFTENIRKFANLVCCKAAQEQFPPSQAEINKYHLYQMSNNGISLYYCDSRIRNISPNPMWLPRHHHSTTYRILQIHTDNFHCGVSFILSELRVHYFIERARGTIKKALQQCFVCRRLRKQTFKLPEFPPLPISRITRPRYPFEMIGMDYAGPLRALIDGQIQKVWIGLSTCLSTRMTYADIIPDLSTSNVLRFLRRLTSLYNKPAHIFLDNQPSFHSAAKILHVPSLQLFSSTKGCQFTFTAPHSPWKGGIYERLIGLLKNNIKTVLKNTTLDGEELRTVIWEATAQLNRRPLTHHHEDGSLVPLRPVDLLFPQTQAHPHILVPSDQATISAQDVRDQWNESLEILETFWNRFHKEYTIMLQDRWWPTHHSPPGAVRRPPTVGEVVILQVPNNPNRFSWPLGRIIDLPSPSTALVQTTKKKLLRPISELVPLELDETSTHEQEPQKTMTPPTPTNLPTSTSPTILPTRTHPMTTRSQFKTALLLVTVFTILPINNATKCPDNATIHWIPPCQSAGQSIGRTTTSFCTRQFFCPTPQRSPKVTTNDTLFSNICNNHPQECACPHWAQQCVHYRGNFPSTIVNSTIYEALQKIRPLKICSTTNTTQCPIRQSAIFPSVELHDHTIHPVDTIRIRMADLSGTEDAYCLDKTSKLNPFTLGTSNFTGTPEFCSIHTCGTHDKQYCFFASKVAFLELADQSVQEIPIYAWGSMEHSFYTTSEEIPTHHCKVDCSANLDLSLECSTVIHKIEICSVLHRCFLHSGSSSAVHIQVPSHLFTFASSKEILINIWKDSTLIDEQRTRCTLPQCQTACRWCYTSFVCWTALEQAMLVLIIVATICLLWLCSILLWILTMMRFVVLFPIRILKGIHDTIYRVTSQQNRPLKLKPQRRRTLRQTWKPITLTIVFFIQGTMSISTTSTQERPTCVSDVAVTGSQLHCEFSPTLQCKLRGTSRVTLLPFGASCLTISEPNASAPIAYISIQLREVKQTCTKEHLYFTRDHTFSVTSSHRCSSAGSCSDDKCETMGAQDLVPEFSTESATAVGFSACEHTCGCLSCAGCFYCDPSCVFYRHFTTSTTGIIYEIYECASWRLKADLEITMFLNRTSTTHIISIYPGEITPFLNYHMKIQMDSANLPLVPRLGRQFLQANDRITIIQASQKGVPVPGTVGQLQCQGFRNAHDMKCQYAQSTCNCHINKYTAQCSCSNGNVSQHFHNSSLPLSMDGFLIAQENSTITATYTQASSATLNVFFDGMKLHGVHDTIPVTITTTPLEGCFDCGGGASTNILCTSERNVAVPIKCSRTTFSVRCTKEGFKNLILLAFNEAEVDEKCTYMNGKKLTTLQLKGQLAPPEDNKDILNQMKSAFSVHEIHAEGVLDRIKSGMENVFSFFKIYYLIITCVAIIILCFLCYPYFVAFTSRFSHNSVEHRKKMK